MEAVDVHDAQARFPQLVDQVAAGEDVVISRNGKPVARLTRLDAVRAEVRFGLLSGRVIIADDFDEPLSAEVLQAFEGP
jgi:prevent-host-death family protein